MNNASALESAALKSFGVLSTIALDAWNAGAASWLFAVRPGGVAGDHLKSVLMEAMSSKGGDLVAGFNAALSLAVAQGLDLKVTSKGRSLRPL